MAPRCFLCAGELDDPDTDPLCTGCADALNPGPGPGPVEPATPTETLHGRTIATTPPI